MPDIPALGSELKSICIFIQRHKERIQLLQPSLLLQLHSNLRVVLIISGPRQSVPRLLKIDLKVGYPRACELRRGVLKYIDVKLKFDQPIATITALNLCLLADVLTLESFKRGLD